MRHEIAIKNGMKEKNPGTNAARATAWNREHRTAVFREKKEEK